MTELRISRLETLRKDGELILHRGRMESDNARVLITTPLLEHSSPVSLKRLEHEYSLREELDPGWAARPIAFARHQGRPTLLSADPGGEPLDRFLGRPLELSEALRLAIGVAAALGKLHERGLIHKDLKPANILVEPASAKAWLMGFGIASRLPREHKSADSSEVIAGTLPYMAPEQTGRMNRSIDQ